MNPPELEAPDEVVWKKSDTEKKSVNIEVANPMSTLLAKLDLWLMQQPEWQVVWNSGRGQRREAARLVAKHLMTLPVRRG